MTKLHICGNSAHILSDLVTCGADLYNIDHLVDFRRACEVFGKAGKAFKGNVDPVEAIMQATPEAAEAAALACLKEARGPPIYAERGLRNSGCDARRRLFRLCPGAAEGVGKRRLGALSGLSVSRYRQNSDGFCRAD